MNLECVVENVEELGSHHMFLAKVVAVHVDEAYMDEKGKFHLNQTGLLAYSHGEYTGLGKKLGTFGWSVKKAPKKAGSRPRKKSQKKLDGSKRND